MKFKALPSFSHAQQESIGVLLVNLGTPDAPTKKALRRYLAEFLSDPRVVEIPRLLWLIILHALVLPFRPKRSARAYQKIWTERGSPLLVHTKDQSRALEHQLQQELGPHIRVHHAMRYGSPSVAHSMQSLLEEGVRQLIVLPMYPQYSGSTTGSTFDALSQDFRTRRWLPHLRFIGSYHDFPPYIAALAQKVKAYWDTHGRAQKLLMSFHGLPQHFLKQGDPYHCQCHVTGRLLAEALGLSEHQYLITFQSRFGKAEWLKPYTEQSLKALPAEGIKHVQVVCPGFPADCLETLEEIAIENREYFLGSGGERYEYIPALNAEAAHISALTALIKQNLGGWSVSDSDPGREQRYQRHPYNQ